MVGNTYYLKATVRNTEAFPISNAQVNLYWADPSLTITRSNAHLVGSAFVSVDAGKTADALCLSPWTPSYVNQGHECLVAEVIQGSFSPTGVLDAENDPHVAQRNLSVIMMSGTSFHFPFEVWNAERQEQVFTVSAQQASSEQLESVVRLFGQRLDIPAGGTTHELGFVASPCPDMHGLKGVVPQITQLSLGPYGHTGYSLVGRLEGGAALIHITQTKEHRQVGGLSVLILHRQEEKR